MKVTNIRIENINKERPEIYIETETQRKFLWWNLKPIIRTFMTNRKIAGRFYSWVELPNKTIVPDGLSFQLDEWLDLYK